MQNSKSRKPVTIATVVSLLVLALALVFLGRGVRNQSESWNWVVHTREVLQQVQSTLTSTSEAEAAQRGFLLTGNEAFAVTFDQMRAAVLPQVRALEELTRDNPRQQQSLRQFDALLQARLEMLERVMREQRAGQAPGPAVIESGRLLKVRILAQAERIRAEEQRLLLERQRRAEEGRRELILAVATISVVSVLLIVLLWVISSRDAARLRAKRARLDAMLRSILDGVIATDLHGTVGLMNPVAEALTGTSEGRAIGRPLEEVLHLRDQASGEPLGLAAALRGVKDSPLLLSDDGREYVIELNAAPIHPPGRAATGTVLVFRDVTERHARERALLESEANNRHTVELNPQIPWKATVDGGINDVSERWISLTGQTREEVLEAGWAEVVHPDDLPAMSRAWMDAVASGEPYDVEHRIHTAGGTWRWMRSRAMPRRAEDGRIVAWYGFTEDIHARKEAELALIRREAQLRNAQRALIEVNQQLEQRVEERTAQIADANAELRAFAHTVAHDLRAPLRNVEGFATALLEDEAERMSEDGKLFAGRIVAAVVRMDRLITDLLAYSRLARTEIRYERVELDNVVKSVLRDLESQIGDSGAQLRIAPGLPAVRANAAILVQILDNLVSNAIKFVTPGVVPRIEISGAREGMAARLSITDNGIGIAPEHREHVFGVFERLHGHERYPGTGIGLAIVKKGLERMDGSVRILDGEGGEGSGEASGTRFELTLPAAD